MKSLALIFILLLLTANVYGAEAVITDTKTADKAKTFSENINVKALEKTEQTYGGAKLKIESITYDEKRKAVKVNMQAWIGGKEKQIINPIFITNPPSYIVTDFSTRATKKDEKEALLQMLEEVAINAKYGSAKYIAGDPTFLIYSNAGDGQTNQSGTNEDFTTLTGGDGNGVSALGTTEYLRLVAGSSTNKFTYLTAIEIPFDTSAVNDTDTIDTALLRFRALSTANGLGNASLSFGYANLASVPTLAATDFKNRVRSRVATDIAHENVKTGSNNNVTFTNTNWISKTGYSTLYMGLSWDMDNSFGGTWGSSQSTYFRIYMSEQTGTTSDPYIYLTTSEGTTADTTPPVNISGLTNTTSFCHNMTFNWSNPTTADFNHSIIRRNNTFWSNVSNSTTSHYWDSLSENTAYTLSITTCDFKENCNQTYVNKTATTDYCSVPVTPTPTPTPTVTTTTAPSGSNIMYLWRRTA